MKTTKFLQLTILLAVGLFLASTIGVKQETERINKASDVLVDMGKMKEAIPHKLLSECEGVVIIPKLINAGLGVGGKRGKGVALVKLPDGKWSNPVFITLTGGSIGFQAGVQSVDLVLVFKHKGVLTKVKNGDFTIGGDVSATAGPVGRNSSASTDHKLEAEIYSYSRSRGAFAGISINGSNLSIDKSSNSSFYGKDINSQIIFDTADSSDEAVNNLKTKLSSL